MRFENVALLCLFSSVAISTVKAKLLKKTKSKISARNYFNDQGQNTIGDDQNTILEFEDPSWSSKKFGSPDKSNSFFRPGAKLTVDPMFQSPLLDLSDSYGITSTFSVSFPFTILLDKFEMQFKTIPELLNTPGKFSLFPPFDPFFSRSDRAKRSALLGEDGFTSVNSSSNTNSPCRIKISERLSILKNVEGFFNSYSIGLNLQKGVDDGKSCMLRAICEIHENSVAEESGTVGELLVALFSIKQISGRCSTAEEALVLDLYIKAEVDGKHGRCREYFKKCSKSLFFA